MHVLPRLLALLAVIACTFDARASTPAAVSTYECASLYWKLQDTGACRVRYRAGGAAAWRAALELVYDVRDGEYHGSLVGLQAGTAYGVELNACAHRARVEFRTQSDQFPIGKTTIVPPGERSTSSSFVSCREPARLETAAGKHDRLPTQR